MFQLTRNGPVLSGSLESLRDRFATEHCVVLRNMLEATLLEQIQRNIERAQWRSTAKTNLYGSDGEWATEFTLDDPITINVIDLLLNQSGFLNVIRIITGCNQISDFNNGRIYRMAASHQHYIS